MKHEQHEFAAARVRRTLPSPVLPVPLVLPVLRPVPFALFALLVVVSCATPPRQVGPPMATPASPSFDHVQRDLFSAPGAQPTAWADYDNDGDLDLFVGFRGRPNRLYRNDAGTFTDVAVAAGVGDSVETRAAAWGDYDADGRVDLYVGFTPAAPIPNKLYRNEGGGRFRDVAANVGVADKGTTRQPSFIDFDNDGDLDLFVAFRDRPNALYRQDAGRFTDVAPSLGIADPRKTVGVAWFDWEQDGDLDAFVANQDGDANGFFVQANGRFTDMADALGISAKGRGATEGSVGTAVTDYDNDGDLDLYVANYGPDWLLRNDGARWTNVASSVGLALDDHSVSATWGDVDHDGHTDLYVVNFLGTERDTRDHLFVQRDGRFVDAIPPAMVQDGGSHGLNAVDFDRDGDLDLLIANNHATGTHYLFRNTMPAALARQALAVTVADANGRATRAGSEVRVYRAGSRTLLGTRLVDTGGGYDSQGATPVHVATSGEERVDVEVTYLSVAGRQVTRVPGVRVVAYAGRSLVVRAER